MKRMGILGVNTHTESLIRELFKAIPDAQIFLSPGSSESAQILAREFPCWTLDSHQALVDEVDIIFINADRNALHELSRSLTLHRSHTLISLAVGVQVSELQHMFNHSDCARLILAIVNDSNKPNVILTTVGEETERLFSLLGPVSMLSQESDFNLVETNR